MHRWQVEYTAFVLDAPVKQNGFGFDVAWYDMLHVKTLIRAVSIGMPIRKLKIALRKPYPH